MKKLLIIPILFVAMTVQAGGGWTQAKGKAYLKLSQFALIADSYFNPEGNIIGVQPKISFYSTSIYAEYGITDRLTGVLYFPFYSRAVLNNLQKLNGDFVKGDELNSVGDTDLTLKYGLIKDKPVVVSASLTLGLPLGKPVGGKTQSLSTGDGEFNQMITLEASRSFYPIPAYATVLVAFNNRTKGLSDEWRWGAEAGYTFKKLTAIARLYSVQSFENSDKEEDPVQGIFSNNIEYLSLTYQLAYSFNDKFGVSTSLGTAFSGKRILADPTYTVGAFLKL